MRNLALFSASIAAVLLAPAVAGATCEPPSVSWANFPSAPQCVGGVIGFVANQWGIAFPPTGGHPTNGNCWATGACMYWVDQLPMPSGHWNAHSWGSVAAQTYDIAVFPPIAGDPYGHVAVIDHVVGNTLWLMDDNWDGLNEKACAWEGHSGWVHSATWQPYGFFRLKSLEPCGCKAGDTQTEDCACGTRSRTCESCSWSDWGSCTLPDYAATVVDMSAPQTLRAGETGTIWADFQNVGTAPWSKNGIWMGALGDPGGKSPLFSSTDTWPAWNVSAVLGTAVPPGDVGRFSFDVTAPAKPGVVDETFQLQVPGGSFITCPAAEITPSIQILPSLAGAGGGAGSGGAAAGAPDGDGSPGGCSQAPSGTGWAWGAEITLALLLLARARRAVRVDAR
jgi:hypothetical protein